MTTRCKFKIDTLSDNGDNGVNMTASAVYGVIPNTENAEFFKWTPSGQLAVGCVRKESLGDLAVGDEIYLDISKAPKE
jgi:hypothetical protein